MRDFKPDPQAIMNAHAKSFSWAAKFLSPQAKQQAAQLYAYARLVDDLVDEPSLGEEVERMALFEANCQSVLGKSAVVPPSVALGQMLTCAGVDQQVICSFHEALRADAQPRHLQSLSDVLSFAYGVAGTVGQMMRPILGAQPQADPYAVALGMAMQLTNIARDVQEDAQRGRCYLPRQWLPENWQLAGLLSGDIQARQSAFVAIERLIAQAEQLYAYAEQGFVAIPERNRRAIEVACVLYRGIGRKILSESPMYWQRRVHLSRWEKVSAVCQVMLGYADQRKPSPAHALQLDQHDLQRIPGFPAALA
jgi:15-cis-phytoene synthase